jgi:hypothetical protein
VKLKCLGWLLPIVALWLLFGLGQWLCLSLEPLRDHPVYIATLQILAAGSGIWSGLWLAFNHQVVCGSQSLWERAFWLGVASGGLLLMSFTREELDRHFGEFVFGVTYLFGAPLPSKSNAPGSFAYWMLLAAVPAVLWFVRPLMGWLEFGDSQPKHDVADRAETGKGSQAWQWICHPWLIRSAALLLFWWWLRAGVQVRTIVTETSGWLVLLTVAMMGLAVAATVPVYLAARARSSWMVLLIVFGFWGLMVAAYCGGSIGLHRSGVLDPRAPWYFLLESLQWLTGAAIVTYAVSFWLVGCAGVRPWVQRARYLPEAVAVGGAAADLRREGAAASLATGPSLTVHPFRMVPWLMALLVAGLLYFLCTKSLQWGRQSSNLCLLLYSDQDAWQRSQLVARMQTLQAADPTAARLNVLWERYPNALVVDSVGNLSCAVTRAMTGTPNWTELQAEVNQVFPQVNWLYDFPVFRPEDAESAASWQLKIDGDRLPLRDLPAVVHSRSWEIHGGVVATEDFARLAIPIHSTFLGTQFVSDLDLAGLPATTFRRLEFRDCRFATLPLEYPALTSVTFSLASHEAFLSQWQEYVQAILNGARVVIRSSPDETRRAETWFTELDLRWRSLLETRAVKEGLHVYPAGPYALMRASGQLPPNVRSRVLETDGRGQVIGLVARSTGADTDEVDFRASITQPLSWLAFEPHLILRDFHLFGNLISNSRLVKIERHTASAHELWLPLLKPVPPLNRGPTRLYLAGVVDVVALEGLASLTSLEVLILEAQPLSPAHVAALGNLTSLPTLLVLTAQATPDANERLLLQPLKSLPGLNVQTAPVDLGLNALAELP